MYWATVKDPVLHGIAGSLAALSSGAVRPLPFHLHILLSATEAATTSDDLVRSERFPDIETHYGMPSTAQLPTSLLNAPNNTHHTFPSSYICLRLALNRLLNYGAI